MSPYLIYSPRLVGRFAFHLLILFHLLFCLSVLSAYVYAVFTWEIPPTPVKAMATACILPVFLLLSLISFWPKNKQAAVPSRRRYLRWSFVLVMVFFTLYQVIDSPPPQSRYGLDDIISNDPELNRSSQLLDKLFYMNTAPPDLLEMKKSDDYRQIETYSGRIREAWGKISPQREVVPQLAAKDRVLHRPMPGWETRNTWHIRKVACIYHSYALLLAREGDIRQAVEILSLFHLVCRKGLEGSVSLLQKMLWMSVTQESLRTGFQIVHEYKLDKNDLALLASAFTPITMEEARFTKCWIGEYISYKKMLDMPLDNILENRYTFSLIDEKPLWQKVPAWLLQIPYQLTFQKNRTEMSLNMLWNPLIERSRNSLISIPAMNAMYVSLSPPLRNLGGWFFHQPPIFLAYEKRMVQEKVKSDIFSKYLQNKLGSKNYMSDYFINGQYSTSGIDGKLISAGQDGQTGTADDITLEVYYHK